MIIPFSSEGTLILLLQRAKALGYLDESTEPEGI